MGIEKEYQIEVIDDDDVQTMMIRLSPELSSKPDINESSSAMGSYGSYVYVHVDARTSSNQPILLPENSVHIIGNDTPIDTGSMGFWVSKDNNESLQLQIK